MAKGMGTFKNLLLNAGSAIAETIGMAGGGVRRREYTIDRKAGKRGAPFRHYCQAEAGGTFYEQVGPVPAGGRPKMRRVTYTYFLHATKGWRRFRRVPQGNPPRRYGPITMPGVGYARHLGCRA